MSGVVPGESLSVMYVEDDPVTRELVAQTLPKRFPAWTVMTAENGQVGLDMYRQHRPDIIITDVNMPIMNGILMASEIKMLNPDVVIIAVTAYSETNYLLNAIEIGISHYVLKPIDYRKLFEALEKSSAGVGLRRRLSRQEELIEMLTAELESRGADGGVAAATAVSSPDMERALGAISRHARELLERVGVRLTEEEHGLLRGIETEVERMEQLRVNAGTPGE